MKKIMLAGLMLCLSCPARADENLATFWVSEISAPKLKNRKIIPAPKQGGSLSCTPVPLRTFVATWGLRIISGHRPGAVVAGSRRRSLHSYCDGQRGAVDVRGAGRGVISAAIALGFGIGTYSGRKNHIHLSIGGNEGRFHKHVRR